MAESVTTAEPTTTAPTERRVSPGASLAAAFAATADSAKVQLREVPFRTMIGLRTSPGGPAATAIQDRLGCSLPAECGAVTTGAVGSVLWLAPDEFLVVSDEAPQSRTRDLTRELAAALVGERGSAVDLSANRTTFLLSGPAARSVLEKGCPLDLHPRAFRVGAAYVTSVGAVALLLWRVGEDAYELLPRSSFAEFLGRWLLDPMLEYAGAEIA